MKRWSKYTIRRKKVILINLREKINNVFCDISSSTYKYSVFQDLLKRLALKKAIKDPFSAHLEKKKRKKKKKLVTKFFKYKKRLKCDFSTKEKMAQENKYRRRYTYLLVKKKLKQDLVTKFFLTIKKKKLLSVFSNGSIGYPGVKRQDPFSTEKLGQHTGKYIEQFKEHLIIILLRSHITRRMRSFFRGLSKLQPNIYSIIPCYRVRHGHIRLRKGRRV